MVKTNKRQVYRNHTQCRKAVCIICLRKADREATTNQLEKITTHTNRLQCSSNQSDEIFPTGLCTTCRLTVVNELPGCPLPQVPNFRSFAQDVVISYNDQGKCQCLLCRIATSGGREYHPLY